MTVPWAALTLISVLQDRKMLTIIQPSKQVLLGIGNLINILGYEVLVTVPIFVLESWYNHLSSLPRRFFQSFQNRWSRLPPFWDKDDERKGFAGVRQELFEMGDHRIHKLFTERWIGFKRPRYRFEIENRPFQIKGKTN